MKSIRIRLFAGTLFALGASHAAPPPNILFLLTDDQRYDALGAMGNPIIRTPQLDSLSRQGVTFVNAFTTTAICWVSRGSILTGQYMSRSGLRSGSSVLSPSALPLIYPRILRDSLGYFTGFIGKWGLGDQPASSFDKWWGYPGQGNYEIKTDGQVTGHLTPLQGDQAIEFLEAAKAARKPFCLQISFKAPHIQDGRAPYYIPDPADMPLYADDRIPSPPLSDPAFFRSLPAFLRDTTTELRRRWVKEFSTPALYQESMKNYYRLITGVDKVLGRLRIKLAELGLDQNTVIIFSSDHGYFIGDRGYSGKWMAYQVSSRVPLILYDPRLPPERRGKRPTDFALNLDIPETILGLAGAKAPRGMQGRNLMGLINDEARTWRSEFYFEENGGPAPGSEAVITHRYSYIVYPKQDPAYEELYDLKNDPEEAFNLIGDPKYKAIADSLRARHAVLRASVGRDDSIPEAQRPVSEGTTRIALGFAYRGRVGRDLDREVFTGRQYLFSKGGDAYDGTGRRLMASEAEPRLRRGDEALFGEEVRSR